MSETVRSGLPDGALLSKAIKTVRARRRLTTAEVARRMNLPTRTYERFEAGETRLNMDYLHRFARAVDCDPHAVLFAVLIGSPAFAARAADNRFGSILMIGLRYLDAALGDRLADFEVRTLVSAVTAMTDRIVAQGGPDDPAEQWLRDGLSALDAGRPRPGRR